MTAPPALLPLSGLLTGILVGMTGTGAGSITTPLLLLLGIHPTIAVGSDLVYGTVTKGVGAWRHLQMGTVDLVHVGRLALGSVPGVLIGSLLVGRLGGAPLIKPVLGMVLTASALWTLSREARRWWYARRGLTPAGRPARCWPSWLVTAAGAVVGLLVGLTSAGSGPLVAVVLFGATELDVHSVVGTDIAHAVLLLGAGALAHWGLGHVDLRLVAMLAAGSVPGVIVGSWLARRAPVPTLKATVSVLVLLAGLSMM